MFIIIGVRRYQFYRFQDDIINTVPSFAALTCEIYEIVPQAIKLISSAPIMITYTYNTLRNFITPSYETL